MTIKSNVSLGVTDIAVGDTVVLQTSNEGDRVAVSAMSLHNTSASTINIKVYESPDLTSASGTQVEDINISPGSQIDVNSVIGQGFNSSENIIMVADAVGSNAKGSVITYDGGD